MSNHASPGPNAPLYAAAIRRAVTPADVNLNEYYDLLDVLIVLLFGLGPVFISPSTGTL